MQTPQSAPAGAECALHPGIPAVAVCTRCGNFTCAACQGTGLCPQCARLTGAVAFPFSRDDFDFGRLWNFCVDVLKREWLPLGLGVLLLFVAAVVANVVISLVQAVLGVGTEAIVRQGLSSSARATLLAANVGVTLAAIPLIVVAQAVPQLGLLRMCLDVLQGRRADLGQLFSQAGKAFRYVGQQLLLMFGVLALSVIVLALFFGGGLAIAGGGASSFAQGVEQLFRGPGVALIVLGGIVSLVLIVYVTLSFVFGASEIVFADAGAVESLVRSWQLVAGFRLTLVGYFIVLGLAGLAAYIVGLLACCIGVIPAVILAMAFMQLFLQAVYLALRTGSGLPPPPAA